MPPIPTRDVLPCRHNIPPDEIQRVKNLLTELHRLAPEVLERAGVDPDPSRFPMLLRSAVESLRGTAAATTSEKKRFTEAVLEHGKQSGAFKDWKFVGSSGRQDYRVDLADGTPVSIEAKGCPDGNNTNIWDRPGWAREFVIWFQCPHSLTNHPGEGLWSGIGTRLLPKLAAEGAVVDAVIFWDGRCGSDLRPCPKQFGVTEGLRSKATDIGGQDGREWLPPPCIYLMPDAQPNITNNPRPNVHTVDDSKFTRALMGLFGVPTANMPDSVHSAAIERRGTPTGTQIRVELTSRAWPDGAERQVESAWKSVRRE